MASHFLMPQASPTMTVGVVSKWVAPVGTRLTPGSVLAQVETDKATMDIEVFDTAFVRAHLVAEGAEVPPGAPIAVLAASMEEDIAALLAAAPPAEAPKAEAPKVEAPKAEAPKAEAPRAEAAPPKAAPPVEAAVDLQPRWMGQRLDPSVMEPRGRFLPAAPRVMASPLARALAAEKGVDLRRVRPSGPGGRVVAADVEALQAPPVTAAPADEALRLSQMRKTIARRLTEVHQQVPVFYLTTSFDATAFVRLKAAAAARELKLSLNDLLIKAVGAALREVPEVNAWWQGDHILRKGAVDVGVAVALPEGLITPVLRDVDRRPVRELAAEMRELATRAKAGKLTPEEYTGSTFTISNLGMFDIEHFTAILNPPEAAILAVGAAQAVPVVVDGAVSVQTRMKVTMTCDHRVIDGALGARFLQALRTHVECPGLSGL